jgi:NAD(P)-dependent dehydrogenase (short-subunit alcohol dehydrogenase family)
LHIHRSLASRSESRAKAAIQKIKELIPDSQVDFIHFDLTILSSARKAADSFISKEARLDILINNASIVRPSRKKKKTDYRAPSSPDFYVLFENLPAGNSLQAQPRWN